MTGSAPGAGAAREGITLRASALGALGALAIGTGVSYTDTMVRGGRIAQDFGSPVAVFLLVLVAAGLNPLLGCLRRPWHLTRAEVALIYIMALLAAAVPSMGLTSFFLPFLSGAQYYATPENQWADLFLHHVPDWLIPHDPAAIQGFYEGSPTARVDWTAWLPPLMAWTPFLLALYLVMIALMVVMRRQWMDHERLLYPLMQPSLAMLAQDGRRHAAPLPVVAVLAGVGDPVLDRRGQRVARLPPGGARDRALRPRPAVPGDDAGPARPELHHRGHDLLPQPGHRPGDLGLQRHRQAPAGGRSTCSASPPASAWSG